MKPCFDTKSLLPFILFFIVLPVCFSCKKDKEPETKTELPAKLTVLATKIELGFAVDSSVSQLTVKAYDNSRTFNLELASGSKQGIITISNPELVNDLSIIYGYGAGGVMIYTAIAPLKLVLNDDSGREITISSDKNTQLHITATNGFDISKIVAEKNGSASTITVRSYLRHALEKTFNVPGVVSGRKTNYSYQVL